MGKFIFAVVAAIASLVLAESLVCNKCTFGLLGTCLNRANETCGGNDSLCFTQRTTFTALPNFVGFNTQGCRDNLNRTGCNATIGTLLGAEYLVNTNCCAEDRCNTIFLNSAPTTKMTFTAAISAALLAFAWGRIL